jgi:hypothetical protein
MAWMDGEEGKSTCAHLSPELNDPRRRRRRRTSRMTNNAIEIKRWLHLHTLPKPNAIMAVIFFRIVEFRSPNFDPHRTMMTQA